MSKNPNDKRKQVRVQGGWAPPTKARSDRDKPKAQTSPNWMGKIVDQPIPKKFVYEQPAEETRQKPADKVISLRYFPTFIEQKEADEIFNELFLELPWKQRLDVKNGVEYLQPRLTAWYGDHPYSYSGVRHEARTEWCPTLQRLKYRLEEATGLQFNSLLSNLYRDGHDLVAWHSDNESSLGPEPTIASLSFGDTRNFQLRKNPPPEENGDYTYSQHIDIALPHGALLIMEGATQADWQHRIPKEYHDRTARINLTFRVIFPE